jgi:hypothetical protein
VGATQNLQPCFDGEDSSDDSISSKAESPAGEGVDSKISGSEKIDDISSTTTIAPFVLPSLQKIWSRLSNPQTIHYLPSGLFDGGPQGGGGIVLNSKQVREFAPFGQVAGDDVLVGRDRTTTCTILGVARHCLWYVVRSFGGGGGGEESGLLGLSSDHEKTFPPPNPRLCSFDGLKLFGARGESQTCVAIGCWERSSFLQMIGGDQALIIKGGSSLNMGSEKKGAFSSGNSFEEDEEEKEEDDVENEGTNEGPAMDNAENQPSELEKLNTLVHGRGLWTGDLDRTLVLYLEECVEYYGVGCAGCLSREMIQDTGSTGGKSRRRRGASKKSGKMTADYGGEEEDKMDFGDDDDEGQGISIVDDPVTIPEDEESREITLDDEVPAVVEGGGLQTQMEKLLLSNSQDNLLAGLQEARGLGSSSTENNTKKTEGQRPILTEKLDIFTKDEIFARSCLMIHVNELAASLLPMLGLGESHGPSTSTNTSNNNEFEIWAIFGKSRSRIFKSVKKLWRDGLICVSSTGPDQLPLSALPSNIDWRLPSSDLLRGGELGSTDPPVSRSFVPLQEMNSVMKYYQYKPSILRSADVMTLLNYQGNHDGGASLSPVPTPRVGFGLVLGSKISSSIYDYASSSSTTDIVEHGRFETKREFATWLRRCYRSMLTPDSGMFKECLPVVDSSDKKGSKKERKFLVVNPHFLTRGKDLEGDGPEAYFYYFGQVIGLAIRYGIPLDLMIDKKEEGGEEKDEIGEAVNYSLSPTILQSFSGLPLTRSSLYQIDSNAALISDVMSQLDEAGVREGEGLVGLFREVRFCIGGGSGGGGAKDGDQELLELVENGKNRPLQTLADCSVFSTRLRRALLLAGQGGTESMYDGIMSVFPGVGLQMMDSGEWGNLIRGGGGGGRV